MTREFGNILRTATAALMMIPFGALSINAQEYGERGASIGMVLPLNTASGGYNHNYMEFYAGSLLALEELKEEGHNVTLNLYDQSAMGALDSPSNLDKLRGNRLLIGPVKKRDVEMVLPFAQQEGIAVVSPMDGEVSTLLKNWNNLIQVPPAIDSYRNRLYAALKEELLALGQKRLIIFRKSGSMADSIEKFISDSLAADGIQIETIEYGILEGRGVLPMVTELLSHEEGNVVFCHSTDEAFVTDVVRNIGLCVSEGYAITSFGNAKWKNISVINAELYHQINLHLILNYYVDYNRADVKSFLFRYRALYGNEPGAFAFQGYDVTRYFASLLCNSYSLPKGLQVKFNLGRRAEGESVSNSGMHHIVYNSDFTLSVTE